MRMWKRGVEDARALSEQDIEVWTEAVCDLNDGTYLVSNLGRFARFKGGKLTIMRGSQATTGYVLFAVTRGSERRSMTAHRMVLISFEGGPPSDLHTDVGHLGVNDKTDNRLCRLAWQTRSENMLAVAEARRAGLPASSTSVSPTANPTYSLDEVALTRGIRLFEQGKLTLADLAVMLSVSRDVARAALVGTTWRHIERNMAAIEHFLGREGEVHHKATVSDAALAEAFARYTQEHWSGVQFAEHLGISQITAHSILKGRTRNSVPRPSGFQYPWPDAATMNRPTGSRHGCAKVSELQLVEVFDRAVSGELATFKDVQAALGLSKGIVYGILCGDTWTHVPRPDGWEDALRRLMPRYKRPTPKPEEEAP